MSTVTGASRASAPMGATFAGGGGAGAVPGGSALMPGPESAFATPADGMAALYMLMSQSKNAGLLQGQNNVRMKEQEKLQQIAEEKAAHEREQADEGGRGLFGSIGHIVSNVVDDAEDLRVMDIVTDTKQNLVDTWNDPAFWKDVEKGAKVVAEVAAVVAASATTVVTFGAGAGLLVGVGVLISAAAMADSELHVLQKCGVDEKTAQWLDTGAAVAGCALTLGGGGVGAGTSVAERIATVAGVVAGGAQMTEGAAHVRTGHFEADAMDAQADAKAARHAIEKTERLEKFLLEALDDSKKSQDRALESLRGAMQIQGQTMVIASGRA